MLVYRVVDTKILYAQGMSITKSSRTDWIPHPSPSVYYCWTPGPFTVSVAWTRLYEFDDDLWWNMSRWFIKHSTHDQQIELTQNHHHHRGTQENARCRLRQHSQQSAGNLSFLTELSPIFFSKSPPPSVNRHYGWLDMVVQLSWTTAPLPPSLPTFTEGASERTDMRMVQNLNPTARNHIFSKLILSKAGKEFETGGGNRYPSKVLC